MNVPVRLVCRDGPAALADALWLPTRDADTLVRLLGSSPHVPTMYAAGDGVLIHVKPGHEADPTGTVRLRRAGGNAFLPADADLVPPYFPDELEGLTKSNGLIFLPGGTAYAFDLATPLTPSDWLQSPAIRRDEWQPLPTPPELPDRIFRFEHPTPPAAVLEILDSGKPDDANPMDGAGSSGNGRVAEEHRPPGAGLGTRVAAGAAMAAAGILAALGKLLRAPGLAKRGAELAKKALESVPRLSERLLGEQEAALRDVLRQLKTGDIEKALRKAPIAVPDPDVPGKIDHSARLSERDTRFSLRDLIAGGSGGASVWMGGGDVWGLLANEYRRLAAEAVNRGDYRRAAYLYGVLLRDPRAAAGALERGGHDRDAAILYRDKIRDAVAAAAAFDRAGEPDEAIRLYESMNRFESAGDIAKRIGEDDRAAVLYHREAASLAMNDRNLDAGDLIRIKLGNTPRALAHYQRGWRRDRADAIPCGLWVLTAHLGEKDWDAANRFLNDVETTFAPPRTKDAGLFFNQALASVGDVVPEPFRADLEDRVRLAFAKHLRAAPATPDKVRTLFTPHGPWAPPVLRDALVAATAPRKTKSSPHLGPPITVAKGTVRHVAVAADTRDLVIATDEEVVVWSPDRTTERLVAKFLDMDVIGLAVNDDATDVAVLGDTGSVLSLSRYRADRFGTFTRTGHEEIRVDEAGSTPKLDRSHLGLHDDDLPLVVCLRDARYPFRDSELFPLPVESVDPNDITQIVICPNLENQWEWTSGQVINRFSEGVSVGVVCGRPGWQPKFTETLYRPLDWILPEPYMLQITGVDAEGDLYWSECDANEPSVKTTSKLNPAGYVTACLIGPHKVAAITADGVVRWLRPRGASFDAFAPDTSLPTEWPVVAIAARPVANEVVAVFENGTAIRIPTP